MGKDRGAYQDPVLSTTKVEKPEEKKKKEKQKSNLDYLKLLRVTSF